VREHRCPGAAILAKRMSTDERQFGTREPGRSVVSGSPNDKPDWLRGSRSAASQSRRDGQKAGCCSILDWLTRRRNTTLPGRRGLSGRPDGGSAPALPGRHDADGASANGVFVTLSDESILPTVTALTGPLGLGSPQPLKYGTRLYFVHGMDGSQSQSLLDRLNRVPGVRAYPNVRRSYAHSQLWKPDDPELARSWALANLGEGSAVAGIDGRVLDAWQLTRGSSRVVVGVLDDGVDVRHPDLVSQCLPPLNYPPNWEARVTTAAAFGGHRNSLRRRDRR
jgi:hypothetical protein